MCYSRNQPVSIWGTLTFVSMLITFIKIFQYFLKLILNISVKTQPLFLAALFWDEKLTSAFSNSFF